MKEYVSGCFLQLRYTDAFLVYRKLPLISLGLIQVRKGFWVGL